MTTPGSGEILFSSNDPDEPAGSIVAGVSKIMSIDGLNFERLQYDTETAALAEGSPWARVQGGGGVDTDLAWLQGRFKYEGCEVIVEAAENAGFPHLRRSAKPSGGDAPGDVRVHTGTLNTSGVAPAPALVRVGVHGKRSAP